MKRQLKWHRDVHSNPTEHKSQGMTVVLVYDCGASEWASWLSFVALSRLRTFKGLFLDPVNSVERLSVRRWLNVGKDPQNEKRRLEEERLGMTFNY